MQLYIRVTDSGDTDYQLIDTLFINVDLVVDLHTPAQSYTGNFSRATFHLSFGAVCGFQFYGPDCNCMDTSGLNTCATTLGSSTSDVVQTPLIRTQHTQPSPSLTTGANVSITNGATSPKDPSIVTTDRDTPTPDYSVLFIGMGGGLVGAVVLIAALVIAVIAVKKRSEEKTNQP